MTTGWRQCFDRNDYYNFFVSPVGKLFEAFLSVIGNCRVACQLLGNNNCEELYIDNLQGL